MFEKRSDHRGVTHILRPKVGRAICGTYWNFSFTHGATRIERKLNYWKPKTALLCKMCFPAGEPAVHGDLIHESDASLDFVYPVRSKS